MALDPLATIDDLDARLDGGIPTGQVVRADALLRDVSATVRAYTGQDITLATSTGQLLRSNAGVVRLPQRPVLSITAVIDVNANVLLYSWLGDDRIEISPNLPDWAWEPWTRGITHVKVTYTHGYDEIPDDIIAVVCQIAGRALGRSADESGITQEAIAGYSYSIGAAAAAGPMGMLASERELLNRYRHPDIGSIRIGP